MNVARTTLTFCGLFQSVERIRDRDWAPSPVDLASTVAVMLTYAHTDHSDILPALMRDGLIGDIWCTRGPDALVKILLLDSAYLQKKDARFASRRHSSRHESALPAYTAADTERCLPHLGADPIVTESTYGNRSHPPDNSADEQETRAPDRRNTSLFTGFQTARTRGKARNELGWRAEVPAYGERAAMRAHRPQTIT